MENKSFFQKYGLFIVGLLYSLFFAIDDNFMAIYLSLPWLLYVILFSIKYRKKVLVVFTAILCIGLFVAGSIYDKNESSLYHPLINKTMIIPHDIYITNGFIDDALDTDKYKSDYSHKQVYTLHGGESVHITAFLPASNYSAFLGLLFGTPDYNIAVNTGNDGKIVLALNANKNKFYKGHPVFWSNNFFDATGDLNNGVTKRYSITGSIFFRIGYLIYPFALLLLLLHLSKRFNANFKMKYHFNFLDITVYAIAYYYILMAAFNDGFSGYMLGIPYAMFLLGDMFLSTRSKIIILLHVSVLMAGIFFIVVDKSKFSFLYPALGTYTIAKDTNYTYGDFYVNKIEINPSVYRQKSEGSIFHLNKGDTFEIISQTVTGNPDFGVSYSYEIQSNTFDALEDYTLNHLDEIKKRLSKDFFDDFSQIKNRFYHGDSNKFYIGGYELRILFHHTTQPDTSTKNRFDHPIVFWSFYLFLYPIIFLLFGTLVSYRNNKYNDL